MGFTAAIRAPERPGLPCHPGGAGSGGCAMSRRNVPAVATPVRADWSEWSQEQDRKRIEHDIRERTTVAHEAAAFTRRPSKPGAD